MMSVLGTGTVLVTTTAEAEEEGQGPLLGLLLRAGQSP